MLQSEREKMMTMQEHQKAYVQRASFSREGSTVFLGHLDLMTCFERAARRAELPILYSQGYNPRPMMVFALPLGVGIETRCDYLDVSLNCPYDADRFTEELNEFLPEGLRILKSKSIPEPKDSIMSIVTTAAYRFEAKGIRAAMGKAMQQDELIVTKIAKGKEKQTDIRPLLISLSQASDGDPDSVEFYAFAGSERNVRPDLILSSLSKYCGMDPATAENARVIRLGLFSGEYPRITPIDEVEVRPFQPQK
ncbi:MAG: TIGR03936 family radical SAM-associated protein [Clostridiales bacterium]|nr:TIGR03936 family radical SAM-associated protein [Clostridiales bacterium]